MNTEQTCLYTQGKKGEIRKWAIEVIDWNIVISHGQLGGTMQIKTERVEHGLAARSRKEQIMSRVASRISKQMDKGYVQSLQDAQDNKPTNVLGLAKPMLAQKFRDIKNVDLENSFIQHKYNGHRCLITKQRGKVIAYSRNGRIIDSIEHITDSIGHELGEGETLDGELYKHGVKLQTISSWIKRSQSDSRSLNYVAYDVMLLEPYKVRLNRLINFLKYEHIAIAPTRCALEVTSIQKALKDSISAGYEGLIIRQGDEGYEAGIRSRSLLKLKQCLDGEFPIIDIIESKDGWAILECMTPEGHSFRVSAPGTIQDKIDVLDDAEEYIGKYIQIEFFEYTSKSIPFHPVAIAFRDIESE
jgi:DNA ligase-1